MSARRRALERDRAARRLLDPQNYAAIDRLRVARLELEPSEVALELALSDEGPPVAADGFGPPTAAELAALELELAEVRRGTRDPAFRCPWCGAPTGGGACRAHVRLEARFQQDAWGNIARAGDRRS